VDVISIDECVTDLSFLPVLDPLLGFHDVPIVGDGAGGDSSVHVERGHSRAGHFGSGGIENFTGESGFLALSQGKHRKAKNAE
jgi:hypothetical protein